MIIDNALSWDNHINDLSIKLSRTNGILAKLRHFVPKVCLLSVYYAVFQSYFQYGCMLWSQSTAKNLNRIRVLQKKGLRILNFSHYNSHTNNLFKDCKILKIDDIIKNEQIKFAFQFINNSLPIDLNSLLQINVNRYNTRNMSKGGLVIPKIKTLAYGERSLRYSIPKNWNEFLKQIDDIKNIKTLSMLKKMLKNLALNLYTLN